MSEKRRGRDGALLSKEELTSDDRKRLRRARKAAGKNLPSDEESGDDAKAKRQRRAKEDKSLDEELRRDKRVTLQQRGGGSGQRHDSEHPEGGSEAFAKSASFFSRLQQNAKAEISGAGAAKEKKSKKSAVHSNGGNYKL